MKETAAIPPALRKQVLTRDAGHCRVCGQYLRHPGIHHVRYGGDDVGMGGRRKHVVAEMVTIGWAPPDVDCHSLVHSDKHRWQPLLLQVVHQPGVTALQLQRWSR